MCLHCVHHTLDGRKREGRESAWDGEMYVYIHTLWSYVWQSVILCPRQNYCDWFIYKNDVGKCTRTFTHTRARAQTCALRRWQEYKDHIIRDVGTYIRECMTLYYGSGDRDIVFREYVTRTVVCTGNFVREQFLWLLYSFFFFFIFSRKCRNPSTTRTR
jgi:hypothetical protein